MSGIGESQGKVDGLDAEPRISEVRRMSKTPMFTAMNAARYQRQELMKEINAAENTHLICYVAGAKTEVVRDDVIGFVDLLHNVPEEGRVDLFLHTCGGDVDACEKLISLLHAKVGGPANLRVVVPDAAKSAGTIMALGASEILMSDASELGMIDPQFQLRDPNGMEFFQSVMEYIASYKEHSKRLREDPKDPVAVVMMGHFDPNLLTKAYAIRDRTQSYAGNLLKMQGLPFSDIVPELISIGRWQTHGQPINWNDAKQLKLPVTYVPFESERWQRYWRLLCLQRIEIQDNKKIFESAFVSQVFEA